jgi:hypothetical protein
VSALVTTIAAGSRWIVAESGNTYEFVRRLGPAHFRAFLMRCVVVGKNAHRESRIGDEIHVVPEWFTERARRAS